MNFHGCKSNSSLGLMHYGLHKNLPSDSDSDDEDFMPPAPGSCTDSDINSNDSEDSSNQKPTFSKETMSLKKVEYSSDDPEDLDYNPPTKTIVKNKNKGKKRKKYRGARKFGQFYDSDSVDSDDSDYIPPQKDPKKRRKYNLDDTGDSSFIADLSEKELRSKGKKTLDSFGETSSFGKRQEKDRKFAERSDKDFGTSDTWASIPIEILSRILHIVVRLDCKGVRYVIHCSQVCKWWNNVVKQPVSWNYADLAFVAGNKKSKDDLLIKLCRQKFSFINVLLLSGWRKITDKGLLAVANNCHHLEVLDISYCQNKSVSKISSDSLIPIAENCPLKRISISNVRLVKNYGKTMTSFLETCGRNLTHINFSGTVAFSSAILNVIFEKCHELVSIDISNTSVRSICFKTFQMSCPKLQELYLANLFLEPKRLSNESLPGFPELRICSLAASRLFWLNDNYLNAILKTAINLKLLDIRGNEIMTEKAFEIPAESVERLYLSRCCLPGAAIKKIFSKWKDSLVEVDLSWIMIFGMPFDLLVTSKDGIPWQKNIEYLNLAGTSVSDKGVVTILKELKNLKMIDLTSCRGIQRGLKRLHEGRKQITSLQLSLCKKR